MTSSSASPGEPHPAGPASDLAVHEARAKELIGWLRLISAPNRSGEVSVNREDAVNLLALLDGLRVQRDAGLALHAPETKRVQAGTVTICAHCGSQLWPCFTAQALGVTS